MKKLLKSIVVTAVVGATLAFSSAVAFAATSVYNFANISNTDISASDYNKDNGPTTLSSDTSLTFTTGGSNTITALKASKPGLVNYTNVENVEKDYLLEPTKSGSQSGTYFTKALIATTAKKDFLTIKVAKGDKIEIYFFGTDSKGATGKQVTLKAVDAGKNEIIRSYTVAKIPSTKTVAYACGVATADGNVTISSPDGRLGIAAIAVISDYTSTIADNAIMLSSVYNKSAANDYYALDTTNGCTYIIHAVTDAEMEKSSLALQAADSTSVAPTSEVYETVQFSDESTLNASDLGATALYAVEITETEGAAPTAASFTWVTK